jgi:hypothetical protein
MQRKLKKRLGGSYAPAVAAEMDFALLIPQGFGPEELLFPATPDFPRASNIFTVLFQRPLTLGKISVLATKQLFAHLKVVTSGILIS